MQFASDSFGGAPQFSRVGVLKSRPSSPSSSLSCISIGLPLVLLGSFPPTFPRLRLLTLRDPLCDDPDLEPHLDFLVGAIVGGADSAEPSW